MTTPEDIAKKHGLIRLEESDDYVRLFEPRGLHWGEPNTIQAIADIAAEMRGRCDGYQIEIGNITGPDRKNHYSKSHQGFNFDMAYPYADGNSGALDHEGKTSSPYRRNPAEVDYDKLYALLGIISGHPRNQHVLIGDGVNKLLVSHIKNANLAPLSKVQPYPGHDDHIHVAMKTS